MRMPRLLHMLVALLLVTGTFMVPVAGAPVMVAVADDDDDGWEDDDRDDDGDDDDWDDDHDRHGDPDDDDDRQDDQDDDGGDDGDDDRDDDDVDPSRGLTIDVTCEPGDSSTTTCTFDVTSPRSGEGVEALVIPEALVCTGLVDGGDGEWVGNDDDDDEDDRDDDDSWRGYRLDGSGPFTVTFDGTVATGNTATYWVSTHNGTEPATGPSLVCDQPASTDDGKDAETATAPGSVTIEIFSCPADAAGVEGFDWYGDCIAGIGDHRYEMSLDDDEGNVIGSAHAVDGSLAFTDLPPGVYDLDDETGNWCRAQSDRVDDDGDLIVVAGETTSVWLFYCQ